MAAAIELELPTAAPFEPEWMLGFFARRAVAAVEEVLPSGYRRSVRLAHGAGVIELYPVADGATARLILDDETDRAEAQRLCRDLLDLDHEPAPANAALETAPIIGDLVRRRPGLRVPGTSDPHELAIRAVLGQQVSLASAATLAARLVAAYGEPLTHPVGAVTHVFPTAAALADAEPASLGMPESRRRALLSLAEALGRGPVRLAAGRNPDTVRDELVALPGIGPWTAEYVALRALHDADAFMPTDLGVKHALSRLGVDPRPARAQRIAERWRPYRAYAQMHLWASLGGTAG